MASKIQECAVSAKTVNTQIWNHTSNSRQPNSYNMRANSLAELSQQQLWWLPISELLITINCAMKLMVVILNTNTTSTTSISASADPYQLFCKKGTPKKYKFYRRSKMMAPFLHVIYALKGRISPTYPRYFWRWQLSCLYTSQRTINRL